ncbi:hypothetical protein KSF78_0007888 [Schistosoma japonicum]|nr:hypothetical protein KSF78_0007888 [Schistosoma japonicum]
MNKYGGFLIRPESPQRFDMIHVDLSEESDTTLNDFVAELENKIDSIAVKYGGFLIRPESPQRFDMIHVDLSEESDTTLNDFVAELENKIDSIAVKTQWNA